MNTLTAMPPDSHHALVRAAELPSAPDRELERGAGAGGVLFRRMWGMPTSETFDCAPIAGFVQKYLMRSRCSVDPFARNKRWATHTNDLNPDTAAEHHLDSIEFLKLMNARGVKADLVIFDPPYSPTQIKECYQRVGLDMTSQDAMRTNWMRERDEIDCLLTASGIVLSFGWNSMGMCKKRNFELIDGLIVCHGVGHNDTICMAERRGEVLQADFFGPLGGGGRGVSVAPIGTTDSGSNNH